MPRPLEETMSWEEIANHTTKWLIKQKYIKTKTKANKFKEWFMERESVGYRFSPHLIWRCYKISSWLRDNKDHFITIVGDEGCGKSTLAAQVASWVEGSSFNARQICLNQEDYIEVIEKKKPHRAIILDEVILQLFSREAMTGTSRALTKLFFIMRALKLCTICCIPNFKYADTILKEHRTKTLIIIQKRGRFKCIRKEGINIILKGLKKGFKIDNVAVPYEYFSEGYFQKEYPKNIPVEEYNLRKDEGIDNYIRDIKKDLVQPKLIPIMKVCKILSLSRNYLVKKIKDGEIKGKLIAGKYVIPQDVVDSLANTGYGDKWEDKRG